MKTVTLLQSEWTELMERAAETEKHVPVNLQGSQEVDGGSGGTAELEDG